MERKKVRLQKVVARSGVSSRRAAERLISEGRVRVNGKVVTELGTSVDPRADRVEVDGRRLVADKPIFLVFHKPRGMVSTVRDPEGRPSIGDLVPRIGSRIFPVGRLDYHTSGVLLLTNDGEFCDGLLHPRRDVPKTYVVKVAGEMSERDRSRWEQGVELEDGKTRPARVKILRFEGGKTWLEVTLFEGRNQQVRRMGEATGFPVMRLARISFAGIDAAGLRPGAFRDLSVTELQTLKQEYGVPRQVPKQSASLHFEDGLRPTRANAPPQKGAQKAQTRNRKSGARPEASKREALARGPARAERSRPFARSEKGPVVGAASPRSSRERRERHEERPPRPRTPRKGRPF